MKKKVFIVCYDIPEKALPPVLNEALYLSKNDSLHVVLIVRELSNNMKKQLNQNNIETLIYQPKKIISFGKYFSILFDMYKFKKKVYSYIKNNYNQNDIVWVASHNTLFLLGRAINNYNYILQLHELLDMYYWRRQIIKYIISSKTKVVVPSEARAYISKILYNLDTLPFVLPNKPFDHPSKRNIKCKMDVIDKIKLLKSKKTIIILYQGIIAPSRPIDNIIKAINCIDNVEIILMGKVINNYLDDLFKIRKSIIHINYMLPPSHLAITSYADIGILTYDSNSLNNIYCAPNKIWEYSGFAIPWICSSLPCLNDILSKYENGELLNLTNIEDIIMKINNIINNYDVYSKNSLTFFNSYEINDLLNKIIENEQ